MNRLIIITALQLFPLLGMAQVVPDKMIFSFDPNGLPVVNVDLTNISEDRSLFIETESVRVSNPGEEKEKLSKEDALIVSPKTFSLSPSDKRTVRLLLKDKATENEQVYRVSFVPKSFSDNEIAKKTSKSGINLTVLLGSGVLVFSPPKNPVAKLSWQKEGEKYHLSNTGNVNIHIEVTKLCNEDDSSCETVSVGKRIYPGKNFTVNANGKSKIHCQRETPNGEITTFEITENTGEKIFPGIL